MVEGRPVVTRRFAGYARPLDGRRAQQLQYDGQAHATSLSNDGTPKVVESVIVMRSVGRGFLAALTAVSAYYFVFWFGGAALFAAGIESKWLRIGLPLLIAVLTALFVWRATAQTTRGPAGAVVGPGRAMLLGAVVLGAIGFALGFFGPIILTPGANQGPLLGLFITGPLGLAIGAVVGWIWWVRNGSHARRDRDAV